MRGSGGSLWRLWGELRKVLVYLDSKDFISLTDKRNTPPFDKIWSELNRLKDEGKCEFGYSFLHVTEVLNPNSNGYMTELNDYGETINEFCSGAFLFISDLAEGCSYPNNQVWAPLGVFYGFKDLILRNKFNTQINDALEKKGVKLTRQQRKQIQKLKNLKKLLGYIDFYVPAELKFMGSSKADFWKMLIYPERMRKKFHFTILKSVTVPSHYTKLIANAEPNSNPLREKWKKNLIPLLNQ